MTSPDFFLSTDLAKDENKMDMADFIEAMAIGHQVIMVFCYQNCSDLP